MMSDVHQGSLEVFRTLKKQVRATRSGRPLREGKLEFFREALGMRGFHHAVRRVAKVSRVDMFSTLEEVESMEKAVLGNDRVELNVQCCIILHFYERSRPFKDRLPDPSSERSWLFGSCESLEEIAYLRSRLLFVEHKTYLREIINISLVHAVEKFFRKEGSTVTWQGLLLVFREARAGCAYRLFIFLLTFLQERDANMPTAAATLFLSYVACSVYVLAANLGNYMCVIEEKIISKLLGLGASPMITREHHPVLFKRLSSQLETNRGPWWIELDNARARSLKRYPTALNRLMAHEWSQSFVDNMAKYACCSLDAVLSFKARYKVHKVASLACLAAQKVRELDLQALSPTLKFIASKHRPLFLQVFGGLR